MVRISVEHNVRNSSSNITNKQRLSCGIWRAVLGASRPFSVLTIGWSSSAMPSYLLFDICARVYIWCVLIHHDNRATYYAAPAASIYLPWYCFAAFSHYLVIFTLVAWAHGSSVCSVQSFNNSILYFVWFFFSFFIWTRLLSVPVASLCANGTSAKNWPQINVCILRLLRLPLSLWLHRVCSPFPFVPCILCVIVFTFECVFDFLFFL